MRIFAVGRAAHEMQPSKHAMALQFLRDCESDAPHQNTYRTRNTQKAAIVRV